MRSSRYSGRIRSALGWGLAVAVAFGATFGGALAEAELVDRIVAIIDRDVILLSEAERAMALADHRSEETPTMEDVVERMIETRLVEREVARFADSPVSNERVDEAYERIRASFDTERAFLTMLSERGMSEDDLRSEVRRQLTVSRYLERRFRALAHVSDEDIDRYFDEEILPELAEARGPSEAEREQIRRILEEKRFNDRVEQWISGLKSRSHIRRYVW